MSRIPLFLVIVLIFEVLHRNTRTYQTGIDSLLWEPRKKYLRITFVSLRQVTYILPLNSTGIPNKLFLMHISPPGNKTRTSSTIRCSQKDASRTQKTVERKNTLHLDMQSIQESATGSYSAFTSLCYCATCRLPFSCTIQVQRIKNEFTVQVYEIHGRMALESV